MWKHAFSKKWPNQQTFFDSSNKTHRLISILHNDDGPCSLTPNPTYKTACSRITLWPFLLTPLTEILQELKYDDGPPYSLTPDPTYETACSRITLWWFLLTPLKLILFRTMMVAHKASLLTPLTELLVQELHYGHFSWPHLQRFFKN